MSTAQQQLGCEAETEVGDQEHQHGEHDVQAAVLHETLHAVGHAVDERLLGLRKPPQCCVEHQQFAAELVQQRPPVFVELALCFGACGAVGWQRVAGALHGLGGGARDCESLFDELPAGLQVGDLAWAGGGVLERAQQRAQQFFDFALEVELPPARLLELLDVEMGGESGKLPAQGLQFAFEPVGGAVVAGGRRALQRRPLVGQRGREPLQRRRRGFVQRPLRVLRRELRGQQQGRTGENELAQERSHAANGSARALLSRASVGYTMAVSKAISTKPPSGMRDFLAADVVRRRHVLAIVQRVYESFGFVPLETPTIENLSTLLGKYGPEGDQLLYRLLHRRDKLQRALDAGAESEADLAAEGLRYDLTVPLARVVANYKDLPAFYKRYQIQPVWRADRPARGRFREFYQCDVDITGTQNLLADAEVCGAIAAVLRELGFADFRIQANHRELLRALVADAGIAAEQESLALIALDKLDKVGVEGVREELADKGIAAAPAAELLSSLERMREPGALQRLAEGDGAGAARCT